MLDDVRVLEVSSFSTMYAGQLLADFGASVVTCEPPGGADGRRVPPFAKQRAGLERGLLWMACNRGKRGCTLDVTTADGAEIFSRLTSCFDVVIVDERHPARSLLPDVTDAACGGPAVCSIRPFSRSGSKRDYEYTELVMMAASGAAGALAAQAGRPLLFPHAQSPFEVGVDAVVAILATLFADQRDGAPSGELIRISQRSAVLAGAFSDPLVQGASRGGDPPHESGRSRRAVPSAYRCRDGFALITLMFGSSLDVKMIGLANWLIDLGVAEPSFADTEWSALGGLEASDPRVSVVVAAVTEACARSTRAEITAAAGRYGFFAAPIMDAADILSSGQLERRGVFTSVDTGCGALRMPLRFAHLSGHETTTAARPPRLGEHTAEVLSEHLGVELDEVAALFAHGVV